jgi:hypothetical protein
MACRTRTSQGSPRSTDCPLPMSSVRRTGNAPPPTHASLGLATEDPNGACVHTARPRRHVECFRTRDVLAQLMSSSRSKAEAVDPRGADTQAQPRRPVLAAHLSQARHQQPDNATVVVRQRMPAAVAQAGAGPPGRPAALLSARTHVGSGSGALDGRGASGGSADVSPPARRSCGPLTRMTSAPTAVPTGKGPSDVADAVCPTGKPGSDAGGRGAPHRGRYGWIGPNPGQREPPCVVTQDAPANQLDLADDGRPIATARNRARAERPAAAHAGIGSRAHREPEADVAGTRRCS